MDKGSAEAEAEALDQVAERLVIRFPDIAADTILAIVNQTYGEFSSSPIRDFVPLLVERSARERLVRSS